MHTQTRERTWEVSITFEEGGVLILVHGTCSPPLWGRHCSVKSLAMLPAVRQQREMNIVTPSFHSTQDPSPGDGITHIQGGSSLLSQTSLEISKGLSSMSVVHNLWGPAIGKHISHGLRNGNTTWQQICGCEVAMRINLWLGVPKTIGNLFSGGHDPQVENCWPS